MSRPRFLSRPRLALLLACLPAVPASADTQSWALSGGGNWFEPLNWNTQTPDAVDEVASFGGALTEVNAAVSLGGQSATLGTLELDSATQLVLFNGTLAFDVAGAGGSAQVTTFAGAGDLSLLTLTSFVDDDLTVSAGLGTSVFMDGSITAGSQGLVADGAGALWLRGDNAAWAGAFTALSGDVLLTHSQALGAVDTSLIDGASVSLRAGSGESFEVRSGALWVDTSAGAHAGGVTLSGGALGSTLGGRLDGGLVLASGAAVGADAGQTLVLAGGVSGVGDLVFAPSGTVRLESVGISHTGGLEVHAGVVELLAGAAHSGATTVLGGALLVSGDGSLSGAGGLVTVQAGGLLGLEQGAGGDAMVHDVVAQGVVLQGGTLRIAGDFGLSDFLDAGSTGGSFVLDGVAGYSAGGSNTLDLNAPLGGGPIVLGASGFSSLDPALGLVVNSADRTLRFGAGSGVLEVGGVLSDGAGPAVHVAQAGPGETRLTAANTYTGDTTVTQGVLHVGDATGLGTLDGDTFVAGTGRLDLAAVVGETLHLADGAAVRLLAAGTYNSALMVGAGVVTADAPGLARLSGPIDVADSLTLHELSDTGSARISGTVSGAGDLTYAGGQFTLDSAGTYTGHTFFEGLVAVGVDHADALGSAAAGSVLRSANVRLNVPSAEPFRVEGGTLYLTQLGADYANPVTLAGGTLRAGDNFLFGVVELSGGIVMDGDAALHALDPIELSGALTGAGDLTVSGIGEVFLSGGADLDGEIILDGSAGLFVQSPVSTRFLRVPAGQVVVEDDLTVTNLLSLQNATFDWRGGALELEHFDVFTTVNPFLLGTDVDITALRDGSLTGATLNLVGGSSENNFPNFVVTRGATVRQTGDDLRVGGVGGQILVGNADGPGTLRLEGGSLTTMIVNVRSAGGVLEIAGGTLDAIVELADQPGSDATLRITSGLLDTSQVVVGNGGTALVEHSGGTADIFNLQFGAAAGPGGVYELSGSGVLEVNNLWFHDGAPGTLRINGGTMTLLYELNDPYEGPGTAGIEVHGGELNAGQVTLRTAGPGRIDYIQTGGTANFDQGLQFNGNAQLQITGGTLNVGLLDIIAQPDTVEHTGGTIVADFFNLRALGNDPLRYELSDGGIIVNEGFFLTSGASGASGNTLTFVQTGGGVSAPNSFELASSAVGDQPTRYELAGGTLNAGSDPGLDIAIFGNRDDNRAEFVQTGGVATFDGLRLDNALVQVDVGTLNANTLTVSAAGPDIASRFEQNGGNVNVAGRLTLASSRSNNVDSRYRLTAGNLAADSAQVGGDASDATGRFEQSGGTATFGLLTVTDEGLYELTGGTLAVRAGLVNQGGIDLQHAAATVRADGGILDLASQPLLRATNANIVGLPGSVITLPAGFDTAAGFGSFNNLGATHFQGDTLFIPVGPALVASGDFNDHIETRADITASPFGAFNPLGGLRMVGDVDVNLGADGRVRVLNTASGMDGGTLTAQELIVGTSINNGPDARFVMDGGVIQLASIGDSSQQRGVLGVNSRVGTESTFVLNDGVVRIDGENQSANFSIHAIAGTAAFEQHSGSVLLPGSNSNLSTGGSSSAGTARFVMTGGAFSADDGGFDGGSAIDLAGGTLSITRFASIRRSHDNPTDFTVSGGTFTAPTVFLDAFQTDRLTAFNVTDGLVQVGRFDIDTARVTVSGGRLEADNLSVTAPNFAGGGFHAEYHQAGGVTSGGTRVLVGDGGNGRALLRLTGGLLEAPIITLSDRGAPTTVELLTPGVRMRATDRLILGEGVILSAVPGATIHLDTASLEMEGTSASDLQGLENLTLLAEGNLDIEIGGQDLGATLAGFDNNFALRELVLGDDDIGLVRLVDEADNAPADTQDEALYVDRLVLGAGSGLNLNGLNVYYHQFIDLGGLVLTDGGSLIHVPLNVPGDLSGDDYVGAADLDILLAHWGDTVTPGDLSMGDASGDGLVGQADLDIVTAQWGQGIAPQGTVPEPASGLALLAGVLTLTRRRRRSVG